MTNGKLAGRVALVTGAARGQGRSHAVRFAREGADVILVDVCAPVTDLGYPPASPDDLDETAGAAEKAGARVVTAVADVRDLDALQQAVERGAAELGRLDVVVANAGISAWGRLWEITPDQWRAVLDTNLTGTWHTLKAAAPLMIKAGNGGSIITISSMAALKPLPAQAHYGASKHGVVGLTRAAALELGEYGIRANSVHPWTVETDMATDTALGELLRNNESYLKSFGQVLTEPPMAAPSDITDAVLWLASDDSRTVTGIALPVALGATLV
ncbi:mycofactocin-coupled SDR family oxidoreductase [Actinomadura rugatobispora]|uniref:Mycofactocin-coupled SDR family oxidoreductase n=1 Tax=Actinomadura rugatobispora TaxID=1994 RepID=A0ABW1A0I2_9ACTN|nr:mycofactocin-coupled SDR family oxidoreductase [Actinomadura rugatobispora]